MAWQYTPITPLLVVAVLVSTGLIGYLLVLTEAAERDRAVWGLLAMLSGAALWSLSDALALSLTGLEPKILLEVVEAPVTMLIIVGWFVFAAEYTHRERWLSWPVLGSLVAIAGVGSLLVLTNQFHGLMWSDFRVVTDGGFAVLAYEYSTTYIVFVGFTYLAILAGIYALLTFVVTTQDIYRGQALALVVAATVPTLANVKTQLQLPPYPNVDLSAIALTISAAALAFAIVRYRLLDVEPVARRRVVERMRDGYVVLDDAFTVVDLNPPAAELLGSDSVIGRDVREFLPAVGTTLFEGDDHEVEFVLESESGDQFVQARLSPLGADDDSLGQLLVLRDITERRQLERRYQTLIENASDIIVVLDREGTITYASPSVERVLGLDPDTLVGTDAFEFIRPADRDGLRQAFEEGIEEPDSPERFEYHVMDADGNWRVLEGLGRNLLSNPYVEGVVVNARDITERKERERELERQNERLDEFASVVSHDLRNPLEVARGRLELARESGDPAEFERVEQAHDRMETIIENLLTLAREGETVGETEPVALEAVATEAWETVETAGATVTVETETTVEADRDRLRQLFENLFRNSVEHGIETIRAEADGGEDVITVRVGAIEDGFFVADDGPGLPDTDQETLFEFGHSTEGGTGFGLAIVREIAEAHGWDVTATDPHDDATSGARFEFTGIGSGPITPDEDD